VEKAAKSQTPQSSEAAESLVLEHFERIDASWKRSRDKPDLLGVLRVRDDGDWFIGMSGRRHVIEESPDILSFFPQLAEPAWEAEPHTSPGHAVWLIVRAPELAVCVRLHRRKRLVRGGDA
jgi:hypothetical protein